MLVTTSIESLWPKSGPILFLGDWCLRYSRKEAWKDRVFSVIPYHWDQRTQIPLDLAYITETYESVLLELAQTLNQVHGVDHSIRYWRIVVGPWLYLFCQVAFDRWKMIQSASLQHPNCTLIRVETKGSLPASPDMASFSADIRFDPWNERLFADLAEGWTEIQAIGQATPSYPQKKHVLQQGSSIARRITIKLYKLVERGTVTKQKVSLYKDYMRVTQKLNLGFLLGQFPRLSSTAVSEFSGPQSAEERDWRLEISGSDDFTSIISTLVPIYIPVCYLEGYSAADEAVLTAGLPNQPRVIMTANAFDSDEIWKLWAGRECDEGAKLVIAQHGGHYGAGAWSAMQNHEVEISDRYLSWGWSDPLEPKVFPAPATKLIGLRPRKRTQGYNSLLLVKDILPRLSYWIFSAPLGPQFESYLEDQFRFTTNLAPNVRKDFIVRLREADYGWDVQQRWSDREPQIQLDSGQQRMEPLLKQSRLCVCSYNATTFLESFVMNIPTVMFWNPRFNEVPAPFQHHYDGLRRANILFDDPESCAAHVNSIWHDVPRWWASKDIQAAVHDFSQHFAYVGNRPLRELKTALAKW